MTARAVTGDRPWVVAIGPGEAPAEDRTRIADAISREGTRPGSLVLLTCRRLEWFGVGATPGPEALAERSWIAGAARARVFEGRAAVERVLRIAAGLESAVVGEDQILHQVRASLGTGGTVTPTDPRLRRLVEVAIGVGRRARAKRPLIERSLADRAIAWLLIQSGSLAGRTVVVAGAGPIGAAAALAATRAGARLIVASRDVRRANALADRIGGRARSLADARADLASADGLVLALAGPWPDLADIGDPLPLVADLSAPSVVPLDLEQRLGARFIDLDRLTESSSLGPDDAVAVAAYIAATEALIAAAADAYEAWLGGRGAVMALRQLRSRAEWRREREIDRLFRRLPTLDARQRALIEQLSEQLVAALLDEPSRRLRDDRDGSGLAAAMTLFGLETGR